MQVIKEELLMACDVDDTLILWRKPKKGDRTVKLTDPYDGKQREFVIHRPHVKLLKDQKQRGFHITVWSGNGYRWAQAVVVALGLEPYVDVVQGKLVKYVDDLKAKEILGTRVYIKYE